MAHIQRTIETTYSNARENFAAFLDKAIDDKEIIVITRKNHEDVALIAWSELSSILETLYLLGSRKNARRLYEALERSEKRKGRVYKSADEVRKELGLEEGEKRLRS